MCGQYMNRPAEAAVRVCWRAPRRAPGWAGENAARVSEWREGGSLQGCRIKGFKQKAQRPDKCEVGNSDSGWTV